MACIGDNSHAGDATASSQPVGNETAFDQIYWKLMESDEQGNLVLTPSAELMCALHVFKKYLQIFESARNFIRYGQCNYALRRLHEVIDQRVLRYERETRWIEEKEVEKDLKEELDKDLDDYFQNGSSNQ